MERGEGSNQFPRGKEVNTKNDQNDDSSLKMVIPFTSLNPSHYDPDAGPSSGPMKRGRGRPKGSKSLKNLKRSVILIKPIPNQETGNSELVSSLMMKFDAVRRRLSQAKSGHSEATLTVRTFKDRQLHTNAKKRVGSVPGVNVGDIFFLWGELGLVGLHVATLGIEFMGVEDSEDKRKLLAISIVSSGKNADEGQDPDTLIYTGFGGTGQYSGGECDQKMKKMNLSLETALRMKSVVRVIRAVEDERRTNGKIYIYDGLYSITNMWLEEGKHGFMVFKFGLSREPDQKPAFGAWKSIEQWKKGLVARPGLVLEDLSFGAENLKVSLVNEVDEEKSPGLFTYVTSLKQSVINVPSMVDCCTCGRKTCCAGDEDCPCVRRNGGELPYVEGVLVTRRPIVYECGDSCFCSPNCKNKMVKTGLKFRLEVFKTVACGWGLRSWDPIRAGSFICEYAGDIIEKGDEEEDDYIFDNSRVSKSFQWNYEPELVGEDDSERVDEEIGSSSAFVISAKKSGNVARFMNHSCSPNVFWQQIAREENGVWCMYIGFFAMKHIPPLMELRYDYGVSRGDEKKKKMCLCRSKKCSGSFG